MVGGGNTFPLGILTGRSPPGSHPLHCPLPHCGCRPPQMEWKGERLVEGCKTPDPWQLSLRASFLIPPFACPSPGSGPRRWTDLSGDRCWELSLCCHPHPPLPENASRNAGRGPPQAVTRVWLIFPGAETNGRWAKRGCVPAPNPNSFPALCAAAGAVPRGKWQSTRRRMRRWWRGGTRSAAGRWRGASWTQHGRRWRRSWARRRPKCLCVFIEAV